MNLSIEKDGVLIAQEGRHYIVPYDDVDSPVVYGRERRTVGPGLKIFGVVGKLGIGSGYLLVITGRQLVVRVRSHDVFKITKMAAISLESETAARHDVEAIDATSDTGEPSTTGEEELNTSGDEGDNGEEAVEDSDDGEDEGEVGESERLNFEYDENDLPERKTVLQRRNTVVLQNVLSQRRPSQIALEDWIPDAAPKLPASLELLPKLISCLTRMVCNGYHYFSYTLDLTKSLVMPHEESEHRETFMFNHHLASIFKDTPLYLPILEGFVGSFELTGQKEKHGQVVLVSRRSIKRPGVRYLRRGVDANGYCANFVETEQVVELPGQELSFLILRGSMPVFFKQSPYSLQPQPRVVRTEEDSFKALDKHFKSLKRNYDAVLPVSLVSLPPGKESQVGELYEHLAHKVLNDFVWFDFHKECAGLKFENVSKLFDTAVGPKIDEFGWNSACSYESGWKGGAEQKGVLRVNCIDCLDRTNVVQSSCARRVLDKQLKYVNWETDSADLNSKFNALWADNGDALSKQYTGTGALKGDYTRTRRRNYRGVLTDAFLTLSRYFYGVVSDFFTQAVLDFIHGNADEIVFDEFAQNLESPDTSIDFESIKQSAVDITAEIVLASDSEGVLGGWWLLTPKKQGLKNMAKSSLREVILLVSTSAMYICNFDFKTEKVLSFQRIPLSAVTRIQQGVYFEALLSQVSKDPGKNIGFLVEYENTDDILKSTDSLPSNVNCIAFKFPLLQLGEISEVVSVLKTYCPSAEYTKEDLISYKQARGNTTLWNKLEYQFKRAIWG
ncbi:hypothetical protein TRVA0_001S03730 [Trichomonascus vanleenenianus]|uniref:uncharacterized protein n=1 Tax=Trichomonascus vanleenenianus TaxID=2268995 RepID=UPI003ECB639B